jgi:hypothetical protein
MSSEASKTSPEAANSDANLYDNRAGTWSLGTFVQSMHKLFKVACRYFQ